MEYIVRYTKQEWAGSWKKLSDTYPSFNRAATIATALEIRGFKTIIEQVR